MKKVIKAATALLLMTAFLVSCGGPTGPEGPPGPPGPEILPTSFEFNATLTPGNGFEFYEDIPGSIEVLDSDVVIAFVLEGVDGDLDIWRQLPVTEFNSKGTVLFDFDFTAVDVRVFLDANYNLTVSDGYEGVLIRAVHIPANFAAKMKPGTLENVQSVNELEQILGMEIKRL